MAMVLKKDFIAGALLAEIVRQYPGITLHQDFINDILDKADEICDLFTLGVEEPGKTHIYL